MITLTDLPPELLVSIIGFIPSNKDLGHISEVDRVLSEVVRIHFNRRSLFIKAKGLFGREGIHVKMEKDHFYLRTFQHEHLSFLTKHPEILNEIQYLAICQGEESDLKFLFSLLKTSKIEKLLLSGCPFNKNSIVPLLSNPQLDTIFFHQQSKVKTLACVIELQKLTLSKKSFCILEKEVSHSYDIFGLTKHYPLVKTFAQTVKENSTFCTSRVLEQLPLSDQKKIKKYFWRAIQDNPCGPKREISLGRLLLENSRNPSAIQEAAKNYLTDLEREEMFKPLNRDGSS